MSRGWTITLLVAVALAASSAGFIYGRKRGRSEVPFSPSGPLEPGKGPPPVIDPKVAVAAKIVSGMGKKPQKV